MLKKTMLLVALLAVGCGEEKSDGTTPSDGDKGGKVTKDASTKDARSGSKTDDEDASIDEGTDDGKDGGTRPIDSNPIEYVDDAGSIEVVTPDGGTVIITPGQDGGAELSGMGSCCTAHDTPGCNNADLMVCVCELRNDCCTKKWDQFCALTVTQRYCQDGVRDCVIKTWEKAECSEDWTSACDTVGISKCEQTRGCF